MSLTPVQVRHIRLIRGNGKAVRPLCPRCNSDNLGPSGYCFDHDPAECVYRDLSGVELDRLVYETGSRRVDIRQMVHDKWGGKVMVLSSSRDKYGEESYP